MASDSGWWKEFLDTIPDGYLDLLVAEEDARRIIHFHHTFIPGLLQTERYASAITPTTTLKDLTAQHAETLVRIRLLRQRAALDDSSRKELVFLIDETSLRRPVGSTATMREQLRHLLDVTELPGVTLIVLPFVAQPHPGLLGPFMLLQYGEGLGDVLCLEWQLGNTVIRNRPELVRRYRELAENLLLTDPQGVTSRQRIAATLTTV